MDAFHGIFGAADQVEKLAVESLDAGEAAAHPGWGAVVAAVQLGRIHRSLLNLYSGDYFGCYGPCIHIAQSLDHMVMPAEAAEMRGCRSWEAARTTCDCAVETMPMGLNRQDIRRRCWNSPWWEGEQSNQASCYC